MKKLLTGIIDFREKSLMAYRSRFSNLEFGQSPDALLVACSDSRVVPNVFASTDPGDLLVLRNIGNLVTPYQGTELKTFGSSVAAMLELAVLGLKVADIIICGHSDCGAMHSLLAGNNTNGDFPFLTAWLQAAVPSYQRFIEDGLTNKQNLSPHDHLSQINVLQQIDHLLSYPFIQERLEEKRLRIHGWWFDLATADVSYYDVQRQEFALIDAKEAKKLMAEL